MYGAIIGDMIGSPYEWHNTKDKSFTLFAPGSRFTDDSAMTVAVAEALMDLLEAGTPFADEEAYRTALVRSLKKWGLRYPDAGYGGRFFGWLQAGTEPYHSWGNGSAMRVSSVGWLYDDLESVLEAAARTAAVTHDHREGIKGAQAIASCVYLARKGSSKEEIRDHVIRTFGYDLDRTCDEIRPGYSFDVSCQGSVPEAIISFLEGADYEDTVRNGVSLGGDSDTIGAMAGAIAEAYFGVPEKLKKEADRRLPKDMIRVIRRFEEMIK